MSLARKQAIISAAVWFVVTVVFVGTFLSIGAVNFTSDEHALARTIVKMVVLPGFVVNFVLAFRAKQGKLDGEWDERDNAVERVASLVTLIVLSMLVFGGGIGLYEVYAEAGAVPVGWLYFMSYGSFCLVSLVHPVARLVADFGGKVDA